MCGRIYSRLSPHLVASLFSKGQDPKVSGEDKCYKSYNAAPTRFMPIARSSDVTKKTTRRSRNSTAANVTVEIEAMRWGMFIPKSNDIVINGRLEEILLKPFFRGCLLYTSDAADE